MDNWAQLLSLGEQQRLAFVRVLLARPDAVFLDEATSALDQETEAQLYELLLDELPGVTLVSVAHREAVAKHHRIRWQFVPAHTTSGVPVDDDTLTASYTIQQSPINS